MSGDIPSRQRPARWLAVAGLFNGLLTMLLGLALALIGMGFLNATASGTGMAAFSVGLWTVLACRGLWRQRPVTLAGIAVAWLWLAARIAWDWPATTISTVVVLFLLPLVILSLGALWASGTLGLLGSLIGACIRAIRRHRSAGFPDAVRDPDITGAPHVVPARLFTHCQLLGLSLRWVCVIAVTIAAPHLVWLDRADKLARLATEFAPTNGPTAMPVQWGACSSVFLDYELTQHGAEGIKDPRKREATYQRALADARADLDSIRQAGARYLRAGASGDHLIRPHPDQERVDDLYLAAVRQTGMELLFDLGGFGQHDRIRQRSQTVDQPIPVEGRFDRNVSCSFQGERNFTT